MNTVLDLIYRLLAHPTDAMSDVTTGEKMKESSIIWGIRGFASCPFFCGGRKFCDRFSGIFCRDRFSPFDTQCRGGLYFRTPWRAGDGKRDYGGVHVRVDPLCFFRFLFSYRTVWPGRHPQICCFCYCCLELFLRHPCHPRKLRVWERESLFYQYFSFPSLRHADYCIVCYRYYDGSCRYFGTPRCGGDHKFFLRKRGCRQLIGTLNIAWLWYNDLVLHG